MSEMGPQRTPQSLGFTLIEVIVTFGILVIAGLALATMGVYRANQSLDKRNSFLVLTSNQNLQSVVKTLPECTTLQFKCDAPHPYQDVVLGNNVGCEGIDDRDLKPLMNSLDAAFHINKVNPTPLCQSLYEKFPAANFTGDVQKNFEALAKAVFEWKFQKQEPDGLLKSSYFNDTVFPALRTANCIACHQAMSASTHPLKDKVNIAQFNFENYDHIVTGIPGKTKPPLAFLEILTSKLGQKLLFGQSKSFTFEQPTENKMIINHKLEFPTENNFTITSEMKNPPHHRQVTHGIIQ